MKLATRISSIRRIAWNACRSCSPDSASMCADSLARQAEAGWTRSPALAATRSPGAGPASRPRRPGAARAARRAIARSRRAWPRPIGELTGTAPAAAGPAPGSSGAGGGAGPVTARRRTSRISRLTTHRVAARRQVARALERHAAGRRSARPPAAALAWAGTGPRSPWTTSTGQRTWAQQRLGSSAVGRVARGAWACCDQHLGGRCPGPSRRASSTSLLECGSGSSSPKKNSTKPAQSRCQ